MKSTEMNRDYLNWNILGSKSHFFTVVRGLVALHYLGCFMALNAV